VELLVILGAAVLVYLVALRRPGPRWMPTRVIGALSAVGLLLVAFSGPAGWLPPPSARMIATTVLALSVLGAAWAIGRAIRERRAYTRRAAEELAARAVAEERLRIARDLHDTVAHSLSLITVKAGVAAHVAAIRPEEVTDALRVIENSGRGALDEIRQLLSLLRTEADPAERDPAPGLDRVPDLVPAAAEAGVEVRLETAGLEEVPADVGRAGYRIVQEAVTNVIRHAAPTRCSVRLSGDREGLAIEVADQGPGPRTSPAGTSGTGHGLIGMRERVALYGGEFTAGQAPGGGFLITARLPYPTRVAA